MTTRIAAPAGRHLHDRDEAARIAREAKMLAEAQAQLDAGEGIAFDDLEAWLDRLDIDPNAPLPSPRTSRRG